MFDLLDLSDIAELIGQPVTAYLRDHAIIYFEDIRPGHLPDAYALADHAVECLIADHDLPDGAWTEDVFDLAHDVLRSLSATRNPAA
jgi:hypothetical protein